MKTFNQFIQRIPALTALFILVILFKCYGIIIIFTVARVGIANFNQQIDFLRHLFNQRINIDLFCGAFAWHIKIVSVFTDPITTLVATPTGTTPLRINRQAAVNRSAIINSQCNAIILKAIYIPKNFVQAIIKIRAERKRWMIGP